MRHSFTEVLLGLDPKLRRMMRYWAATGFFYLISMSVLVHQVDPAAGPREGTTPDRSEANLLCVADFCNDWSQLLEIL